MWIFLWLDRVGVTDNVGSHHFLDSEEHRGFGTLCVNDGVSEVFEKQLGSSLIKEQTNADWGKTSVGTTSGAKILSMVMTMTMIMIIIMIMVMVMIMIMTMLITTYTLTISFWAWSLCWVEQVVALSCLR